MRWRQALPPELFVVGSVNLDLVARCERLPRPGETLTDATFHRYPGGKGANQAVAAARLGASVTLRRRVGEDEFADEALAGLRDAGVKTVLDQGGATGVAVIIVDARGENEIVVAPGANADATDPQARRRGAVAARDPGRHRPRPRLTARNASSSMPRPLARSPPSSCEPPRS